MHRRIAAAVKYSRRGLSAQQLADITTLLGYPISRSLIANYESGRKRSLDVTELLVLAHALDVPVLALVFPGPPDSRIEVVPGQMMSTVEAILRHADDHRFRTQIRAMVTELDMLITTAMGGRGQLTADTESS
ncbi:hypothetical protein AWB91_08890 [Mycobacterium paraense]|uniref:HTH cro/C1-type domain-containing protein n=1 Tax=Mycobacterium paraense TaxID=767916 RepID=A0ABX3VS82_9MYCO|nr:hypothetical protein AWB91_08890 [Mycobacterium paraense]ORW38434.1 hypothetical protein AWB88_17825 [Mycobacterium paraense]